MARRRMLVATAGLAAAAVLTAGAAAWACTAFAVLSGPKFGPAESQVEMRAGGLVTSKNGAGVLELRWNALQGPLLAQAQNVDTNLQRTITIPSVPPGQYFIVATVDGRAVARTVFEVTPTPGQAPVVSNQSATATPDGVQSQARSRDGGSMAPGVALLAVGLLLMIGGVATVAARASRPVRLDSASGSDPAS